MEVIPENPILEFLPDTLVAIRNMYNMGNTKMSQSVDILDEWIKKQPHFVNKNFNRAYLERTIIACKGSVEKAKMQIDKLCTFRTLLPNFFICSDVRSVIEIANQVVYVFPLPQMTKEYQRICVVKVFDKELTSAHFWGYYRLVLMILEYLKAYDYGNGLVTVADLRDADLMKLVSKLNLVEFQQYLTIITKGLGTRLQSIHLITNSNVVDLLVKLLKSVLSPKIGERILVHRDIESLYQVVDKKLLPCDMGGNEKTGKELQEKWVDILASKENEKYLAEMKACCTDESLRPTEKFNDQCMGLPGSFRTLTVD